MPEETWTRTHTCGALGRDHTGESVILMGWVASQRDHGGVIFVDLRDRYGITQVVFHPSAGKALCSRAAELKMESVIAVRGTVRARPDDMVNQERETGAIEVEAKAIQLLNHAKPLPFLIKDPSEALDELRLKYRYLDLRRPSMQQNIFLRHKMAQSTRRYFDKNGFVEIETPFLMKSTPEGARDFLVPSRIHKGRFYALPQSPQTYKQLLMVSGYDRYFQIVRCFRDEDLRADRQPEFTQIDVEMSFVDEDRIITLVEGLMGVLFHEILDIEIEQPFVRMSYQEAIDQYGSDSPDLRYDMKICDISDFAASSGFNVFKSAVSSGGAIRGIAGKGLGQLSRKRIDEYTAFVKQYGARGLVTVQMREEGFVSPIAKFVSTEWLQKLAGRFEAETGDVIFLLGGEKAMCAQALGNLRKRIADAQKLTDPKAFAPVWILDFPLLEWSEEDERFVACHHPFTSVKYEDRHLLKEAPERARARAYDLVLNGSEIAGGSIRNHDRRMQEAMFDVLGFDRKTAMNKFGFLMEALEYGAPPHGGIAFGFDRMVMIFAGESSIREVIAFPKTTSALSLMDGSPSPVDAAQLKTLGLKLNDQ